VDSNRVAISARELKDFVNGSTLPLWAHLTLDAETTSKSLKPQQIWRYASSEGVSNQYS